MKHFGIFCLALAVMACLSFAGSASESTATPKATETYTGGHESLVKWLEFINSAIVRVQHRLANPKTPAAVGTALQKLLTDYKTTQTDLTNAIDKGIHVKGKLEADHEANVAGRQAVRAAETACGWCGQGNGQGGQANAQSKRTSP